MTAPGTPRRRSINTAEEEGPLAPCVFMPQTSTPMMLMSSRRQQPDYRGILLTSRTKDFEETRGDDSDETAEEHSSDSGYGTDGYRACDSEPTTPTSSISTASSVSRSSIKFLNYICVWNDAHTPRQTVRLRILAIVSIVLALLLALALASAGTDHIPSHVTISFEFALKSLEAFSELLEVCLEAAGFVVGRAAARFGRGFVKGYNI
ncbi:hypothetical protein BU26DRAFT_570877 [Trematosphaeria pertusa]|uniref:Uncharacterized protein n=1 Tax=Trematosphaeria pertusa TaxID=390896 RepID=A0A6A6HWP3_9PLEO|nr:uncharacterized protein BU26DRAFT_570877 [Trematosphaeria pertusa]KAF2242188.1 hypothetical protein BU26DRAFT_570877 [Trematosphaeria pertusa]